MFIIVFKLIRIADKLTFGKIKAIHALYWPTLWLSHYLNGSGETLKIPNEVMEQAAPLFVNRCGYLIDSHNGTNTVGLHHSTLYEGSGFHGRPSLFYLVGGFTYKVEAVTNGIYVYGEDVYDWHPAEYGKYFTSPIGNNKIICALAQIVLGNYFSSENSVTGEKGISNRLWEDFLKVGAQDFLSIFEHEYILGEDTYVILAVISAEFTGFVRTWTRCKELTNGKNAKYKGFNSIEAAKVWMRENNAPSVTFEHYTDLKQIK